MPATVALHGRDHCPSGPDPIPCMGGQWVAMYDDFVYGQLMDSSVSSGLVNMKFPFAVQSDNSADYYSLSSGAADPELGVPIYTLTIKQSGVYAITLKNEWDNANKADAVVRYYIESNTVGRFQFPGELSGAFSGLYAEVTHDLTTATETWDSVSWTLPVRMTQEDTMLIKASPMRWTGGGTLTATLGAKSLWVVRIAGLDLGTGTWP